MLISTLSSPSAHTYTNPHASSARRMPYSIRHSFSSSKSSFPPGSAAPLQQPCGHVPSPSPLRLLVACHAKRKRSSKDGPAAESSSGIDFSHFDVLAAKPEHRVAGGFRGSLSSSGPSQYKYLGQSSKRLPIPQSVEECLQRVRHIGASPTAKESADTLYRLAKVVDGDSKQRKRFRLNNSEVLARKEDIVQAAGTLVAQLLGGQAHELNAVDISLSAWSLAVLVELDGRVCSGEARQLIDALAMRAVSSNVMEQQADEACRHWSRLLYGIAKVGVTCQDSADVQQLFTVALTQRMPMLLRSKQFCEPQNIANPLYASVVAGYTGSLEPMVSVVAGDVGRVMEGGSAQDWSNLLWSCARQDESGSGRLGQGLPAILRGAAPALASLAKSGSVVPQNLSNVLWAFARFSFFDASAVGELASAIAKQARDKPTTTQNIANALWALSNLGWYDVSVYSTLTLAFVQKFNDATSQELSNVLLSCAEARHWDSSMEGLAEFVSKQGEQQWGKWNGQDLANSLYAWAVLTAAGPPAASASPSFKSMAQQLFGQVSKRGPSAFLDLELSQLFVAHQVAVYGKLPGNGLSADAQLLGKAGATYDANKEFAEDGEGS